MALADRAANVTLSEPLKIALSYDEEIPTVVCGPGSMEGQGHKADEFIALDQLEACDAMLDSIIR